MKAVNHRFKGNFEDYKAYVKIYLEVTGQPECFNEEIVAQEWDDEQDGIHAAIACKRWRNSNAVSLRP